MKLKINNRTLTLILAACCIFPSAHADESRGPEIVFSAGREGGGYWGVAQRMKTVAAESELGVLVKESAGSIQNLDRLADPGSTVNLTLAQADAIEYYLEEHPDLANHVQVMESIGLECIFLITNAERGIHSRGCLQLPRRPAGAWRTWIAKRPDRVHQGPPACGKG